MQNEMTPGTYKGRRQQFPTLQMSDFQAELQEIMALVV